MIFWPNLGPLIANKVVINLMSNHEVSQMRMHKIDQVSQRGKKVGR